MLALRENVSSCSTKRSLVIVMLQAGVEEFPGPLPAVKVVRHVAPMKSPPTAKAPSVHVDGKIVDFYIFDLDIDFHNSSKRHTNYSHHS